LFLVHTDELAKLLESHRVIVKLFADDVKVYLEIVNVSDTVMLQGALDLLNGSYIYCLSANAMLTIIGHVPFDVEYHVTTSRDLGIVIAQDLYPSIHISEIAAKAHQRANCILRSFVSKDINLLMRAFIVYVRPIVQYCSVVWSPSLKRILN